MFVACFNVLSSCRFFSKYVSLWEETNVCEILWKERKRRLTKPFTGSSELGVEIWLQLRTWKKIYSITTGDKKLSHKMLYMTRGWGKMAKICVTMSTYGARIQPINAETVTFIWFFAHQLIVLDAVSIPAQCVILLLLCRINTY